MLLVLYQIYLHIHNYIQHYQHFIKRTLHYYLIIIHLIMSKHYQMNYYIMIYNIFHFLYQMEVFIIQIYILIVPYLRCPLTYLFSHVSIDTIIDSYISLITETNLIYISGKYTSLCYVLEGLISLIYPLKWNHIYYSVTTTKIVDNLLFTNIYSKIPYLIGIIPNNSEYLLYIYIYLLIEKKRNYQNYHVIQ